MLLVTASRTRGQRLHELLGEHDIKSQVIKDYEQELPSGVINIGVGQIHRGFDYPDAKFAILAETDMAGTKKKVKKT